MKKWRTLLKNPRAKRLAVAVGKVAAGSGAALGGLALGLHEVKRTLNATEAQDLWKIASFDLQSPAVETRNTGRQELVRKIVEMGDLSLGAFQDAARHLRPVELQLEELAELRAQEKANSFKQKSDERELIERWRSRGYLNPGAGAPNVVFGRRLTSDAQGVDVGVCVPPYMFPEDGVPAVQTPAWFANEREGAVTALDRWGCVLLRAVLTDKDVASLRGAFGLGAGTTARRAREVGQVLQSQDPNIAMGRYTFGRLHCLLRGSPTFEPLALAAHAAMAPLVHAYFRKTEDAGDRAFLSEAQLVITDPCAESQRWYVNSVGGPGLTVLIPLSRIDSQQGPHTVLPGTHALQDSGLSFRERLRRCFSALCATHGTVSTVTEGSAVDWAAGDALVLDGRVLHRALGNESLGAPVPMLVLRYDSASSPPPGCSRWWLLFFSRIGIVLDGVFRLYSVV